MLHQWFALLFAWRSNFQFTWVQVVFTDLVFQTKQFYSSFILQSNCIPGRVPHGMIRLHRAPRGTTLAFYGVFVNPLHRHLLLQIWEYLVDLDHQFTVHTLNFAVSCPFFQHRILTIRQVDTPSVASEDSDG